jgi:hypothetical protein
MDVDPKSEDSDDDEGSIVSTPDVLVTEPYERDDSDLFDEEAMLEAVQEAWGVEAKDLADVFNFLPEPESILEGDAGPGSATTAYRQMHRSLVEDDSQGWNWQWHGSAGKIIGYQPVVHQRWQALFSMNGAGGNGSYQPFTSRLEWELAHWAVKENISQGSVDRLLQIPEV